MKEQILNKMKWYDYRDQTPEACNLMFAREWLIAREKFYTTNALDVRFDEEGRQYRLPLKWNGVTQLKNDKETWPRLKTLRVFADKNGTPYRLFWETAFVVVSEVDMLHNEVEAICGSLIRNAIFDSIKDLFSRKIVTSEKINAKTFTGLLAEFEYMVDLVRKIYIRYPSTAEEKIDIMVREGKLCQSVAGLVRIPARRI